MANNVKSYEVANLVFSPGDDLDEILNVHDNISLSQAFYDLSRQYQSAAEYYLLLSEKLNELPESVDVYCEGSTIELEGDHPVLDDLVVNGFLVESDTDDINNSGDLVDAVDYDERDYDWQGVDELDYPFDFESKESY